MLTKYSEKQSEIETKNELAKATRIAEEMMTRESATVTNEIINKRITDEVY